MQGQYLDMYGGPVVSSESSVRTFLSIAIIVVFVVTVLVGWRDPRSRRLVRPRPGPPILWAVAILLLVTYALFGRHA